MNFKIDLRHIKYFQAVAEELHFKRAADKLFISQPGLSRQIQFMEKELGVKLFERHNRKVECTAAGKFLFENSTKWSSTFHEVLQRTNEIGKGFTDTLRLGYVGSAMQSVIPQLLRNFQLHRPAVKFTLNELDNSSQIVQLMNDKIDLGFVRLNKVPSAVEIKTVLKEHFCLVVPSNFHLTKDKLLSMTSLKEESFILFEKDYSPTYFEEVMSLFIDSGFSPIISHSSVNALTIFKMVENGFGLAVVPQSLKNNFNMNIKFIELDHFPQRTNLKIVWKKNSTNSLVQSVLDVL